MRKGEAERKRLIYPIVTNTPLHFFFLFILLYFFLLVVMLCGPCQQIP